jgi:TetR/AcrR family transcriptional repressor of nem operon
MPRPRAYDRTELLDQAVRVFWEKGYGGTSVQDLVDATGVQRYGLYESFGDKHGLFLEALERYHATVIAGLLRELERPGAALPEIRALLERLARTAERPGATRGCLLCNTAAELGEDDPEAALRVDAYMRRLSRAFQGALIRARGLGQVPEALNADQTARFLTGVLVGGSIQARTPVGRRCVPALFRTALRAVDGGDGDAS